MKSVDLRWLRQVAASPAEVWAVMSDTDAFNRRAGFGFRFERVDGQLMGESSVAGIRSTWDEHPMDFVAPQWFRSRRRFHQGPVAEVCAECAITPHLDGSQIDYRVRLTPRSSWLRPAVMAVARLSVQGSVNKALDGAEQVLRGEADLYATPPRLHARGLRRLRDGLEGIDAAVAEGLRDRILHAPLVSQYCLRPLQLARQLDLPPERVVLACLEAADAGVLELRWQLLCPRCQAAKADVSVLGLGGAAAHCDSCGIGFDGALGDNVEAVFGVHPDVRSDEVVVHCALSPARTPHVVAQVPVPDDAVEVELTVEEGAYRIELGAERALLEVVPGKPAVPVTLKLGGRGLRPRRVVTGPGTLTMRAVVGASHDGPLVVLRQWRPPFVLTAASLFALPGVPERLPQARLGDDLAAEVRDGWVVVAAGDPEHLSDVIAMTWAAVQERARAHVLVAGFSSLTEAMAFSEACALGGRQLSVSLAHGSFVVLGAAGERQVLGGRAVDQAVAGVERVGCPRMVVAAEALGAPDMQAFLAERQDSVAVQIRPDGSALFVFAAVFSTVVLSWDDPYLFQDDEPPDEVGPYKVLREIDRGGMGMVLEGAHRDTAHRVALKIVLPTIATADGLQQQFFNEAWYAGKVKHPNVVSVENYGLHDDQPWIAMEFLVGRPLSDYLRRSGGRLPLARTWQVVEPLLQGLAALHREGLVHRDLKPKNVFLARTADDEECVKLLDFGLVRRAGVRRDEGLMGTPDYMAPEQLTGDPPGPTLDVFAMGVMMVRMVLGRYPFEGESSYVRALGRVGDYELPDLTPLGAAEPVVRAALAADPADRPADADALRAALQGALGPPTR